MEEDEWKLRRKRISEKGKRRKRSIAEGMLWARKRRTKRLLLKWVEGLTKLWAGKRRRSMKRRVWLQ